MKIYNLIFSNKRSLRIKRHLVFWGTFYVYQVVRMSFLFPPDNLWNSITLLLISSMVWGLFHNILFTYALAYYVVPRFFMKKKYLSFAGSLVMLVFILAGYNFLYTLIAKKFTHAIGNTPEQPFLYLRGSLIRLFGNAPLVCGLFISLKTLKNWHLKELENEQLTREKTSAELQLLKAQIHPHFLFNTLNNIYSFTLTKSPLAAELVQKLSDMLQYMITDCDRSLVPVEKEIQLIQDYIGLEKVRYGDRLDIQMHVNGDCTNCMIVPLLMIPFVENCFKHGASLMRGKQWMHLIININENALDFNLSNSKPPPSSFPKNKKGLGLSNVRKRLELLYPEMHHLNINTTDNTFSVYLKLYLEKEKTLNTEKNSINIPVQTILKPSIHY